MSSSKHWLMHNGAMNVAIIVPRDFFQAPSSLCKEQCGGVAIVLGRFKKKYFTKLIGETLSRTQLITSVVLKNSRGEGGIKKRFSRPPSIAYHQQNANQGFGKSLSSYQEYYTETL
ncbi:hypothetical protein E2C01_036818 [Portunus trituberculatus]|uniref:Uncharacterized protein n=1 Tax=Portunus trituberculatus TaxID=210409 RepID=A0A5B7FDP4_PORTR|nr:hypothetical protein [Portunus trituberculatus]